MIKIMIIISQACNAVKAVLTEGTRRHIIKEQPETAVSRENNTRWLNLPDVRKAGDAYEQL